MEKPQPPTPPPMREYKGAYGVRVNEYKDVDWYTETGKLYPEEYLVTKLPASWIGRLFMSEDQKLLEKALTKNRMLCTEWPRVCIVLKS